MGKRRSCVARDGGRLSRAGAVLWRAARLCRVGAFRDALATKLCSSRALFSATLSRAFGEVRVALMQRLDGSTASRPRGQAGGPPRRIGGSLALPARCSHGSAAQATAGTRRLTVSPHIAIHLRPASGAGNRPAQPHPPDRPSAPRAAGMQQPAPPKQRNSADLDCEVKRGASQLCRSAD